MSTLSIYVLARGEKCAILLLLGHEGLVELLPRPFDGLGSSGRYHLNTVEPLPKTVCTPNTVPCNSPVVSAGVDLYSIALFQAFPCNMSVNTGAAYIRGSGKSAICG